MKTVILLSGGMKSTTLLVDRRETGDLLLALSFDYGQWNARELEYAKRTADRYGLRHTIVKLDPIVELVGNDPLLLNRDLSFIAIAFAFATAEGCDAVAWGAAAGCSIDGNRETKAAKFVETVRELMPYTDCNRAAFLAPYVSWHRAGVVRHGLDLDIDYRDAYSCDAGEPKHCGKCSPCLSRRSAFVSLGEIDPTEYDVEPQS